MRRCSYDEIRHILQKVDDASEELFAATLMMTGFCDVIIAASFLQPRSWVGHGHIWYWVFQAFIEHAAVSDFVMLSICVTLAMSQGDISAMPPMLYLQTSKMPRRAKMFNTLTNIAEVRAILFRGSAATYICLEIIGFDMDNVMESSTLSSLSATLAALIHAQC